MSDSKNKIPAEVQALADKMVFTNTSGVITPADDMYNSFLPDGVTKEIIEKVSNYNTNFITASGMKFGEKAIEAMTKDKKMVTVGTVVPMGHKDTVTFHFERSHNYPAIKQPGDDTVKPDVVKHGVLSHILKVDAGKTNTGMKATRTILNELAFKAFNK